MYAEWLQKLSQWRSNRKQRILAHNNDDSLPQLDIIHYLFQMFTDVEPFQNVLSWTDKNQINISCISSVGW